ncbi:MAG: hypothetical protein ACHQQ3_06215, partial [Gemmatimonadales bacterium]
MDNSLTLARHFARLLWLLIHESQSTVEQKVALRAVVFVSKESSVRLGNTEGRLAVNGLVMPQALAGVRELADRLATHAIEEIEIRQEADAAELLGLARLLAVGASSAAEKADFSEKLLGLKASTVVVRLATVPSTVTDTGPAASAGPISADARIGQLWDRLASATDGSAAQAALDELGNLAEQATREGRTEEVADTFATLLDFESTVVDAEVRRVYVLAVRRLTKPTILRPIARLVVTAPGRMTATERILERCG